SHHCTRSGLQSWATSSTHAVSRLCFISALFSLMVSISEIRLDIQTLSFLQVGSLARCPSLHRMTHYAAAVLAGGGDRGLDLRHYVFQMLEGLIDGKRIHFATQALTRFQRRFQKMTGDFDRQ